MSRGAALAAEAWALVSTAPGRAFALAAEALDLTTDPAARSLAHRASGMASLELHDAETSLAQLRGSLREAEQTSDPVLLAEAEMGLSLVLQHQGDGPAARRHSDRAVDLAPAVPRLALQRALILERLGSGDDALAEYNRAEQLATLEADSATLARVWCNRGVLKIYRADLDGALADLLAAETCCRDSGLDHLGVLVGANLGFLAARRGEIVEALRRLDAATPTMEAAGGLREGIHQLDRCEVLLIAGLPRDAVAAGSAAIVRLEAAGMGVEVAEARVVTAQAALRNGDPAMAEQLATAALATLGIHERGPWQALADEVVLRAQWAAGERGDELRARARRVAGALAGAGWTTTAASARILSARLALELGDRAGARSDLEGIDAGPGAPVALRIQARHAEALLLADAGDLRGAKAALRAGWRALEEHRATLGATELRVGAASLAVEIADLGLQLALQSARPAEVFGWAERVRAGALVQPPASAPRDDELAAALGELRVVASEADEASKHGDDPRPLLRRQAALEDTVRRRAQLLPASEGGTARGSVAVAELLAALGPRVLVELVQADGQIAAVVASQGRLCLRPLGAEADAAREIEALRMALRRMALGSRVPQLRAAARSAVTFAATALSRQLLEPLADLIDGQPLVLVPTGALHSLPWPVLPGIPMDLVVTPSAALWLRGHLRAASAPRAGIGRPSAGGVLLVAGPRLAEAEGEIREIAQLHDGAQVVGPAEASVEAVRDALAGADLAHLACHGHFRADNPLFSSLELADGALSVFELERLERVPRRLVLSACDAGRTAVHPGDELLGLTAALLRLGSETLVASVLPVPDGATRRLMTAFHTALVCGAGVTGALAAARGQSDPERDDDRVAAAAFVALGSD